MWESPQIQSSAATLYSQDTGNVTVNFTTNASSGSVDTAVATNDQNVAGIDAGGETVDDNSSLSSTTNGQGNEVTYGLDFSDPVENVSLRINDIDGDGIVTVRAYDEAGNPIEVQIAGGSELTLSDTDGVAGDDTADSNGGYLPDTSSEYSLLVDIPGPVSKIEIYHTQDGSGNSGINVTDVYFDVPGVNALEGAGNDTLDGGDGDDWIDGEDGSDVVTGGDGDDYLVAGSGDDVTGGSGDDIIVVKQDYLDENGENDGTIVVDGSTEGTDRDSLDLTDFVAQRNFEATLDADGDSYSGSVEVLNDDGEWVLVQFSEIEFDGIVLPPNLPDGVVDGEDFGEVMGPGYDDANLPTDGGGDLIDGADGIHDVIEGNGGDDDINAGQGSDTVSGGTGDDTIFGGSDGYGDDLSGDEGDDSIRGGSGDDTISGGDDNDTIEGGADNDDISGDDGDDSLRGDRGEDTIDGGEGDDTIQGGQEDDTITGGEGDDFIQGNNDDDLVTGGAGNDTLEGNSGTDTIHGGSGDSIIGGADDDLIIIDQDEVDADGENDTGIFADGSDNGLDNDTLDLTDFVEYRNLVETPDSDGNSTSGSLEVLNDDGEWVPVTFAEIENLLLPPKAADGVVDGEESGELMGPGYDDANLPTDGGGDLIDGADGLDDVIEGNGGNDTIDAGLGDDTVSGGTGDDIIDGGADDGDDSLSGDEGNDSILGGEGNDTIEGGDDNDTVRGEEGHDVVSGGAGDDSVTGGAGNDTLDGGTGDDSLTGGSGHDDIDGGEGNDSVTAGSGNDTVTDLDGDNLIDAGIVGAPDRGYPIIGGADGDPNDDLDSVTTGDGNDTILTGDDNDTIDAGDGDNVIDAGFDDDDITSGTGDDMITSGEGSDTVSSGDGDDTIFGGLGPDIGSAANLIDDNVNPLLNDDILDNGDDSIDAGAGHDVVFGEDDNDTIHGGAGNDTLDGGIDDDTITGGSGDDVIIGGQGADLMEGGTGDDTFDVGTFTDPVYGDNYVEGAGDTIVGGEDPGDGDVDTLDLTGSGSLKVIYEDSIDPTGTSGESGRVIFYTDDTQTEIAGELIFSEIENVIPCFTPGAMIATPKGEVPVETLREGDRVITRDNGIQEIRWTGNRTLNRQELAEAQNLKPILIKAGSLGAGLPERDMVVSPQHRVLVTGETPQLYFEESEVLVAAKHLVGKTGVSVLDTMRTTDIHFMFDQHEVVLSDGAWTESFQPGDQTLGAMGKDARDEIFSLFPELQTEGGLTDYAAARRSLKAHEAKLLQL